MSQNVISTLGQHTFKYAPPEFTEAGAPCFSKTTKEIKDGKELVKYPFLGCGYYFWDYNMHRAKKWGQSHYKGQYAILELKMELKGERFLDLAGSRQDFDFFLKSFLEFRKTTPDLTVGKFFRSMQLMEKRCPGTWPFTVIRALNVKSSAKKVFFNHLKDSEMLLDPEVIICFYDKNELNLQQGKILFKT